MDACFLPSTMKKLDFSRPWFHMVNTTATTPARFRVARAASMYPVCAIELKDRMRLRFPWTRAERFPSSIVARARTTSTSWRLEGPPEEPTTAA